MQRETLAEILSQLGEVDAVGSGEEALERAQRRSPSVVVSDLVLPGSLDGLGVLRWFVENAPDVPVVLITGHATVETALEAMKSGAYDYLVKPVDVRRLRAVVGKALERFHIADERRRLREALSGETNFCGMVGTSPAMRAVFRKISIVAPTTTTVLVVGESGTGKELVADAIHKLSGRSGRLVKLNCSAIPENLLESELFGYEKGAFTGAVSRKPGKFELAHKGTLFLDEIGDMPLSLQAKLLRVIETGEVEPLGATEPRRFDVRLVAATSQNLPKLVEEGKFRQELYYRLRVFVIELPPLRERREDIPLLVSYFLPQLSAKLGREIKGISRDVMDKLVAYDWPGNVRQLRNALEEMALLSGGEVIDCPPTFFEEPAERPSVAGKTLEQLEREAIIFALRQCGGNKTKAAKMLGIGLRTLYRKLEKYRIGR